MLATIRDRVAGRWTNKDGLSRPLRPADIIVVAPYNAQVNALQEALFDEIRVGTVDKFQGQEAPICLVSMTASSVEEIPRGMRSDERRVGNECVSTCSSSGSPYP